MDSVVKEAKASSKVDTGYLRRSIRGVYWKNIVTFREIFYGAYGENSKLVEIAKRTMPKDIPWEVIFVDEDGRETTIEGKSKTGRTISRKSISSTSSSKNINAFLKSLTNATKNNTGKGNGSDNEKKP